MHAQEDMTSDPERRTVLVWRPEAVDANYGKDLIDARIRLRKRGKIEAELAASERSRSSPMLDVDEAGQALLDASLDAQKAMGSTLSIVDVLPAVQRGPAWSIGRLRLRPVVEP